MPTCRIRLSRWVSRRIFGSDWMVCSVIHWRRHWLEPWLDRAFWWDWRHCRSCFDWEVNEVRLIDVLAPLRRSGL